MGVPGLLRVLKSITKSDFHISSLKGYRVALDAYCYLHKGCHSCAQELGLGLPTTEYVNYIMSWIHMLHSNGVKEIVVVFDGRSLKMKEDTSTSRFESREINYQKALESKAQGDDENAMKYFQRSVSINFDMIEKVIEALKKENIQYFIAPHEADAQLAFLSINNLVDAVITEDSDALVYGCRRVIYKLNRNTGFGDEILRKNLGSNQELSFVNWNDEQFILFCCLVGSDYCPNLHGMGIKTAHKYASKYKTFDDLIDGLKQYWKYPDNVTNEYAYRLWKAMMTFRYQVIYSPLTWNMKHLRGISNEMMRRHANITKKFCPDDNPMNLSFLGYILPDKITEQFVRGLLTPIQVEEYLISQNIIQSPVKSIISIVETTSNVVVTNQNNDRKATAFDAQFATNTAMKVSNITAENIKDAQIISSSKSIQWITDEDKTLRSSSIEPAKASAPDLFSRIPEASMNKDTRNSRAKDKSKNDSQESDIWAFEGSSPQNDQMTRTQEVVSTSIGQKTHGNKTKSSISVTKSSEMRLSSKVFNTNLVTADLELLQRKKRRQVDGSATVRPNTEGDNQTETIHSVKLQRSLQLNISADEVKDKTLKFYDSDVVQESNIDLTANNRINLAISKQNNADIEYLFTDHSQPSQTTTISVYDDDISRENKNITIPPRKSPELSLWSKPANLLKPTNSETSSKLNRESILFGRIDVPCDRVDGPTLWGKNDRLISRQSIGKDRSVIDRNKVDRYSSDHSHRNINRLISSLPREDKLISSLIDDPHIGFTQDRTNISIVYDMPSEAALWDIDQPFSSSRSTMKYKL